MSAEDKVKLDSLHFGVFYETFTQGNTYIDIPIEGITSDSFVIAQRMRTTASNAAYVLKTTVPSTGTLRIWISAEVTGTSSSGYFSIIYSI